MHEQEALERSYRRLLWAYPRFYRRERGLEILTTMLEAARPGQRRATRGEAFHLLTSGLRCRLVPPGRVGKIAAVVVTFWLALVLSGVGAYAAWSAQPAGRPGLDDPAIAALGDSLAGQPATGTVITTDDPLHVVYTYRSSSQFQSFGAEGWEGEGPVPAGHVRHYQLAESTHAASVRGVLADAYQRLQTEDWHTGAQAQPGSCDCQVFWASRDGLLLRMSAINIHEQPRITVSFYHVEPQGVAAAAIAGFAVGLALAWPAMTWLAYRASRVSKKGRALVLIAGLPALVACAANTVDNVLSIVPVPGYGRVLLAADLMYSLANQSANPLAATVVALSLAASAGVAILAPWRLPRRPDSAKSRSTGEMAR